ncbi:replication initiation protein [Snodgrassella alvi]|uniref:replication initiation protein n=1 Tax=Snodgrassella alvi TaxID=1196083 RepID=UPI000CC9524C|nr:replication initiation protein [Snodgrassella alvi]PIT16541.1 hypothetical protein BGI33_04190 [Snodgrassella alvi]
MTLENFLAIGDKYKEISSLKRFVIAPAVEQINTNTDFNIDISFRKCKREIRWIQLRFNQKQEAKVFSVQGISCSAYAAACSFWQKIKRGLKQGR